MIKTLYIIAMTVVFPAQNKYGANLKTYYEVYESTSELYVGLNQALSYHGARCNPDGTGTDSHDYPKFKIFIGKEIVVDKLENLWKYLK